MVKKIEIFHREVEEKKIFFFFFNLVNHISQIVKNKNSSDLFYFIYFFSKRIKKR